MAATFKVKAVYDYASQEPDDLSFPLGQIITVTEEIDADWYEGEYTDVTGVKKSGIFPNNFVEKYEPEVPSRPTRPSRPAKEQAPITSPPIVEPPQEKEVHEEEQERTPVLPAQSESAPAPIPQAREPPVVSQPSATETPAAEKKPPPVAPKSNAFKDRIAAFNAPAAAPILPFAPGQRSQPSTFIKKPFVAPPPSRNAFVPQPKQENVQKPYVREEDPEIRQRQEDDLVAAQAAGLTGEEASEEQEDMPKPTSLKDRIALLQRQQLEQAQRRVDPAPKKEKELPLPEQLDSEGEIEDEPAQLRQDSESYDRPSLESRERPRVPTIPRHAEEPAPAQHEILSGGEEADQSAAGETTEDDAGTIEPEESDERPLPLVHAVHRPVTEAEDEEETVHESQETEEDEEMDEDTRRRLELRERMAKMSGGMGMAGMFGGGPPGGMPMPGMSMPKKTPTREKRSTEESNVSSSPPVAQARMPMLPIPGLQRMMSPDSEELSRSQELDPDTAPRQASSMDEPRRSMNETRGAPPPIPNDRPVPPTPSSSRPVPVPSSRSSIPASPPVPVALPSTTGLESEESDEETEFPQSSAETPGVQTPLPIRGGAPAVPGSTGAPRDSRDSYFANDKSTTDKRSSRLPPSLGSRPPPPIPLQAEEAARHEERGESEYEGDYDTDIASSAKRKDALKSHTRDPSYDDSTTAEETPLSSPVASTRVPPIPAASRAAPPPPPPPAQQRTSRQSTDLPRAPPPMPPPRAGDDDEYDPYRYSGLALPPIQPPVPPPHQTQEEEDSSDDRYAAPAPRKSMDRPPPPPPTGPTAPQDRVPPPPPPTQTLQPPPRSTPRQSLDVSQSPALGRRSMEQSRPSGENGQIAGDLELNQDTPWWTAAEPLPPVLQGRNGVDLIFESEESTTSKRGGRTTVSKDIYILFIDYSQTIIAARYDSREPLDVSLEQRHEPAPAKLRQDQLESYWDRFGRHIAETANNLGNAKKETTVGDGSSTSLVTELIKSQAEALLPVGTRAYGALVYGNLANASVMQFDEIRPGDIVTLRNAKFEGKHSGPMHQKYKQELGSSHVAIVNEWDGTKKKIRVWEQGREKKNGLKSESYRLGDLKSGEVRVWRVVGREWVGWDGNS